MILITESRLTDEIDDSEISLNNYKLYRCDSTSRHTGGSAIYVRDDITVLSTDKKVIDKNMWLVLVKIKNSIYKGIVAAIYHSPNANHNEFIEAFNEWCSLINEENENVLICGDFNINWLEESNNKRKIHRCIDDLSIKQLVTFPTRVYGSSKTLIDYCLSNKNLIIKKASNLNISDHECIRIEFNEMENKQSKFKIVETIQNYNKEELQNNLKKFDWNLIENETFTDRCDIMERELHNAIKNFVIKKKIYINNKCKWYNSKIKQMKTKKCEAYSKATITNDNNDWLEYRLLRNNYVNEIRKSEKEYYNNLIEVNKNDQRQMWKVLKTAMGSKKNCGINAVRFGDEVVNEKKIIAEKLNTFFIDSIYEINNSIQNNDTPYMNDSDDTIENLINLPFKFEKITINDIIQAINEIKAKAM